MPNWRMEPFSRGHPRLKAHQLRPLQFQPFVQRCQLRLECFNFALEHCFGFMKRQARPKRLPSGAPSVPSTR
jgi:hypothetical protein